MRRGLPDPRASTKRVLPLAVALVLAGCAHGQAPGGTGSPANGTDPVLVTVTLTNASCTPDRTAVPAGPVGFRIINDGGDAVSEVELVQAGRILGEKENLAPGMSGAFTLELAAGDYVLTCPGAAVEEMPLLVTPGSGARPSGRTDVMLREATDGYAAYVRSQVDQLVAATNAFTAAVVAGDVERAKALYGPARLLYERIEPVAESFGDLDPAIDGRN